MDATPKPRRPWQSVLREHGHRLTPQRELVLDAIDHLGHGTPEEIHQEVTRQAPAVNLSTVYRNLALLEELGAVRQVSLSDRTATYHSVTLPAHVHLTCTYCGRVVDAHPTAFQGLVDDLAQTHGFVVDLDRLVLGGRCAECRPLTPGKA